MLEKLHQFLTQWYRGTKPGISYWCLGETLECVPGATWQGSSYTSGQRASEHSGGQVYSSAISGTLSAVKHPAECGDEKQGPVEKRQAGSHPD